MNNQQTKYLNSSELEQILDTAKRRSDRDYAIIFLSYRHGLRCIELLNLKWDYIDWNKKLVYIPRAKGSDSGYHDLAKDEIKLLKRLKKGNKSDFIISGRQSDHLSTARVRQMCKQMGIESRLSRPFHHHMLRHTCGLDMAENANINPLIIQRFLGHRDFRSTEIYLREAGRDFKNLPDWQKC